MRRTLTSIALLAAVAGAALADDTLIVKAVSLQDMETILADEGYAIHSTGEDGEVSVRAADTADTGLIFHLLATACDTGYSDDCLGINMQVRYDADGQETLERINAANLLWAPTSVWYSAGGTDGKTPTVGVSRYVILDGGMTVGNIKENLLNLLVIAPQAADFIWQAGEYAPGGAAHEAAD